MKLDIVTPEGVLFTGEINSVIVPGINGEFEILNNHAPIISILNKGSIRIKGEGLKVDDDVEKKFTRDNGNLVLVINSGTIEAKNNKIIILAE